MSEVSLIFSSHPLSDFVLLAYALIVLVFVVLGLLLHFIPVLIKYVIKEICVEFKDFEEFL